MSLEAKTDSNSDVPVFGKDTVCIIQGTGTTDSDSDVPIFEKDKIFNIQGNGQDIMKNEPESVHNDSDEDLLGKEDISKANKCRNSFIKVLSSLAIEGLMFVFILSYMIKSMITSNMIMDKACQFRLNYSKEICANLSNYTEVKTEVEKIANDFGLYINLLHMGPSALIMIFLAPWSDKYGRKLPLMLAILGTLLDDVGLIFNAYFFDAKIEYLLISSVPTGLSGGFIGFLTIMFCLVSESTTEKTRTRKYAFVELFLGFGFSCGSLVSGLIYKYANSYVVVYTAAAAGHIISAIWVVVAISETRKLNYVVTLKQKICDIFNCERVTEGVKACMKVRENYGRAKIWLIFASVSIIVLTNGSFASIEYTYVHERYNWDPAAYSYVTSVSIAITIVALTIFIPIVTRVVKLRDTVLGIIGIASSIAKNVCIGLAYQPWIYYVGNVIGLFYPIAMLSSRAMISKLVPEDELGKIFAFMSTCEALVPLAGLVAITKIFNATIEVFPGLCYIIAGSALVLPLGAYIWMSRLKPKENEILKKEEVELPSMPGKNP